MNRTTGYEPVNKGLIPLRRSKGSRDHKRTAYAVVWGIEYGLSPYMESELKGS